MKKSREGTWTDGLGGGLYFDSCRIEIAVRCIDAIEWINVIRHPPLSAIQSALFAQV